MTVPGIILCILAVVAVIAVIGSLLFQQRKSAPPKPAPPAGTTPTGAPSATPAPSAAPATKKPWPRWAKVLLWIFVWIPLIALLVFLVITLVSSHRDSIEKGGFKAGKMLMGSILYEFTPENLGEKRVEVPGLVAGVYRVTFSSKESGTFFYKCPGENTGKANIFRRNPIENEAPTFGMLLVRGVDTKKGEEAENGETVVVGEKGTILFSFNLPSEGSRDGDRGEEEKKECKPKGLSISVSFE